MHLLENFTKFECFIHLVNFHYIFLMVTSKYYYFPKVIGKTDTNVFLCVN